MPPVAATVTVTELPLQRIGPDAVAVQLSVDGGCVIVIGLEIIQPLVSLMFTEYVPARTLLKLFVN